MNLPKTNWHPLLVVVLFFGLQPSLTAQYHSLEQCFDLVRDRYSGENAYETTKYVSSLWRLPGNPGFDSSIYYVTRLLEKAGYQEETKAKNALLTYRIEKHPMRLPAWHPVDGSLTIAGENKPLLQFSSNRNMLAINSFSTPKSGIEAEVIYLDSCDDEAFVGKNLKGKIVMAECHSLQLYKKAIKKHGAIGILTYRIPGFNQPEEYPHSIPFTSIPFNSKNQAWGINLSTYAKKALLRHLEKGPVKVKVRINTLFQPGEDLALIAEIKGKIKPEERFVFSAHVQEPGANDNASGVGAQAEMARVAAQLVQENALIPDRTITFLWGDEIRATRRYLKEDKKRTNGIIWGISLDMVGENTDKTGGSFLIEKMPDPSAIWTRGDDKHTEWGSTEITKKDLNPHYFNDYIIHVCQQQGKFANWTVNTNPFEGGSDHQPFLDEGKPGLLFWHFTDVFYHTDADRIDKVSPTTLQNVGISALVSALHLSQVASQNALMVLETIRESALQRLERECELSKAAIKKGSQSADEKDIIWTWATWYTGALTKIKEISGNKNHPDLDKRIEAASKEIQNRAIEYMKQLE